MPFQVQHYALDFQAISLAFLATVLPPIDAMTSHRPPAYVGTRRTFIVVTVMTVMWVFCDVASFGFLLTRPWMRGGNGTAVNVSGVPLFSCLMFAILPSFFQFQDPTGKGSLGFKSVVPPC